MTEADVPDQGTLDARLSATLMGVLDDLTGEEAPTGLGYNDMALLIAQSRHHLPSVTPEFLSRYLQRSGEIPEDSRPDSDQIGTNYLERLEAAGLGAYSLDRNNEERIWQMRDEIWTVLVNAVDHRSEHIPEGAIRGMMLYAMQHQG